MKLSRISWLFIVIAVLFVTQRIVFTLFINTGFDLPYLYPAVLKTFPIVPQAWESFWGGDKFGHSQIMNLWLQPVWSLVAILGRMSIPHWLQIKLIVVIQIVIGSWGIYNLLGFFGIKPKGRIIGGIFYLANTYWLTMIDGGLIYLAFAYALFPLILWRFGKLLYKPSLHNFISAGLLWLIGSYLDIRIVPLVGLAMVIWSVKSLKWLAAAGLILVLGHAFWLLPWQVNKLPLSFSYANSSQIDLFSQASLGHILFFSQPHWFTNDFGHVQPVAWYLAFIPLFAMMSLLWHPKHLGLGTLAGWCVVGAFLVKGAAAPGGEAYRWAFANIPGFAVFRDPSKFNFLLGLGYAGLIGILVNNWKWWIAGLAALLLVVVASPAYTGKMTGAFSPDLRQEEFVGLAQWFTTQPGFARVLWLPTKPSLGFASQDKIWTSAINIVEKRPFLVNVDGSSYESTNYLRSIAAQGLLEVTGIKYIVYPRPEEIKHTLSADEKIYYQWFNNWFSSQPWLIPHLQFPDLPIYENSQASDRLRLLTKLILVVGHDDTYAALAGMPQFKLRDWGIIHSESLNKNQIADISKNAQGLLFNGVSLLDWQLAGLSGEQLIQPPLASGWYRGETADFLNFRSRLQQRFSIMLNDSDFGLGYTAAEGEQHLTVHNVTRNGRLYARLLFGNTNGVVTFKWGNLVKNISTQQEASSLRWIDLGEYPGNVDINIETQGTVNIINALTVQGALDQKMPALPIAQILETASTSATLVTPLTPGEKYIYGFFGNTWKSLGRISRPTLIAKGQSKIMLSDWNWQSPVPGLPAISYRQISQTKYELTVERVPSWVIFSESYDPWWQMSSGKEILQPVPAYDMLNGFYVTTPGKYQLEYYPQHWVNLGLVISVATICILASIIILPL